MLSKISSFIIAIAMVISGVGSALANDSVNVHSNIYLSAGSEFNFKVFMNKKAKGYIKRNSQDWETFNRVVRLYNNSNGSFLNLQESEKMEFSGAVASINETLEKMKSRESQIWLKKVNVTEKVFNFIWDNKVKEYQIEEILELPVIQIQAAMGR